MMVVARPVRDVSVDSFADLTDVPVTDVQWTVDGTLEVTFESDLTPAVSEAVARRMQSLNSHEEELRRRAEQALVANRTYLTLAPPAQSQVVQQVERLTRQNIGIIRQLLGLLDGTD